MCYAKPGPRCSSHATAILEKAEAAYRADPSEKNHKEYTLALEEYKTSPVGIKNLKNSGQEDAAKYYQGKRAERIKAFREMVAAKEESEEEAEAQQQTEPSYLHRVPAQSFDDVNHQVALANRRLARNGIEERFEIVDVEHYTESRENPDGSRRQRDMVSYRLNHPALKIGGWQVAGRIDRLADGTLIAMNAPGQELGGWRPQHQECDHCGTSRRRTNTYLLRGEDGDIKQVGSNCLESFTGIRPEGMWALEYDIEDRMDRRHGGGWGSGGWQDVRTPQNIVAYALVLSDEGRSYRSRRNADIDGGVSTGQAVQDHISPTPRMRNTPEYRASIERIYSEETQERAAQVIEFARNIEGDNDYTANLRSLASQEYITSRHYNFVSSAVAAWRREQDRQTERAVRERTAENALNEWYGEVGERIGNFPVTVTGVRYLNGNYGTTTLLSMKDSEGRTFNWFASGYKEYQEGSHLLINRATVKKHDEYRGTKQTVLTRCQLDDIPRE